LILQEEVMLEEREIGVDGEIGLSQMKKTAIWRVKFGLRWSNLIL
jgi:hypothetical protein